MKKELVRTDKNGTKYFHCTDRCFKCGGTGIIGCYVRVNGGECFDCGGSGIATWDEKEYTPEYEAKLEANRKKRAEKKLAEAKAHATEKNAEFFRKNGFTPDGKTWFVLGNTYDIKDELKEQGAKWDNLSRHWHMAVKPEGREVIGVSVEEMYYPDAAGVYDWKNWLGFETAENKGIEHYAYRIEKAEKELKYGKSTSEHVGKVGDKIEVVVSYIHTASWENGYGGYWSPSVTNLHTFKDESGNMYVWKTGKFIESEYGTKMVVKGTVKEHSEYKGTKQTVLTRCTIKEEK